MLGLASRAWAQASLAGPAAQALRKLRAAGVERDVDALIGIEPRLRTTEPAFEPVKDGVLRRRAARASPTARPEAARPASGTCSRGRSCRGTAAGTSPASTSTAARRGSSGSPGSTGPCAPRGRPGSYEVPDDHEPELMVQRGGRSRRPSRARRCCGCATGAGHSLRRRARTVGEVDDDVGRCVDLDFTDLEDFAEELAGYGPDVVVEAPPELRRLGRPPARGRRSPRTGVRADGRRSAPGDRDRRGCPGCSTMVPWLLNRQGIDLEEAADDLGVSVGAARGRPRAAVRLRLRARCPTT